MNPRWEDWRHKRVYNGYVCKTCGDPLYHNNPIKAKNDNYTCAACQILALHRKLFGGPLEKD